MPRPSAAHHDLSGLDGEHIVHASDVHVAVDVIVLCSYTIDVLRSNTTLPPCRVQPGLVTSDATAVRFCPPTPTPPPVPYPVVIDVSNCSAGYEARFVINGGAPNVTTNASVTTCVDYEIDILVQSGAYFSGRGCTVTARPAAGFTCDALPLPPPPAAFTCLEGPAGPRTQCDAVTFEALRSVDTTPPCRVPATGGLAVNASGVHVDYQPADGLAHNFTLQFVQCSQGYTILAPQPVAAELRLGPSLPAFEQFYDLFVQSGGVPQSGRGCTALLLPEFECAPDTGLIAAVSWTCYEGPAVNCSALGVHSPLCGNVTFGQVTVNNPMSFQVCVDRDPLTPDQELYPPGVRIAADQCSEGYSLTDQLGNPIRTTDVNLTFGGDCALLSYNVIAGGPSGPQTGRGCSARVAEPTGGCLAGTSIDGLPRTATAVCRELPALTQPPETLAPTPPNTAPVTTLIPRRATCSWIVSCQTMCIPAQVILIIVGPALFLISLALALWYSCRRTKEEQQIRKDIRENKRQTAQAREIDLKGERLTQ